MIRLQQQFFRHLTAFVLVGVGLNTAPLLAQTTGETTLTLNLKDVLQLTVNTNAVDLNFATVADYNNGVTSEVGNQLTVISSRPYALLVKTSGEDLSSGKNTIPVSNVSARMSGNQQGRGQVIAALSTADQTLGRELPAALSKQISIQYTTAAGNEAFLKPVGAYVTTLTFIMMAE